MVEHITYEELERLVAKNQQVKLVFGPVEYTLYIYFYNKEQGDLLECELSKLRKLGCGYSTQLNDHYMWTIRGYEKSVVNAMIDYIKGALANADFPFR